MNFLNDCVACHTNGYGVCVFLSSFSFWSFCPFYFAFAQDYLQRSQYVHVFPFSCCHLRLRRHCHLFSPLIEHSDRHHRLKDRQL